MTTENPRLSAFEPLLGEWTSRGTHPYLPGRTLRGTVSFERIEGGAFVRMRSTSAESEVPSGVAIFGSDDAEGQGTMLYFDDRGVSRRYVFETGEGEISWWRDDPAFRQRFTVTVQPDDETGTLGGFLEPPATTPLGKAQLRQRGRRLTGKGQMSRDGKPWEDDLALDYQRVTP